MATLTPTPDYTIAGTRAPSAHSFEYAGKTFHVHRFVSDKGKAAVRFGSKWQFSEGGVPITKTDAPTPEHAVKWFEGMWQAMLDQFGAVWFGEEYARVREHNEKLLPSNAS